MTLAVLALLAALLATAAFAGEACDVPPQKRQSFEVLRKLAGDFGWTIDKMKIDDGCHELRVTDTSGNVLKVRIDPATLEVVDGRVTRKARRHSVAGTTRTTRRTRKSVAAMAM